jgi:hypothetical protein
MIASGVARSVIPRPLLQSSEAKFLQDNYPSKGTPCMSSHRAVPNESPDDLSVSSEALSSSHLQHHGKGDDRDHGPDSRNRVDDHLRAQQPDSQAKEEGGCEELHGFGFPVVERARTLSKRRHTLHVTESWLLLLDMTDDIKRPPAPQSVARYSPLKCTLALMALAFPWWRGRDAARLMRGRWPSKSEGRAPADSR